MTSTSSRRRSTTSTAPLLAVTTPFVAPQSCVDQYRTTSFVSSFDWNNYINTTVKVLASDPGDSRFAACQPPGWNVDAHFQFSPAVCPSGFTAYQLEAVTYQMTVSTAYCCSSGFTLSYLSSIEGISTNACIKDIAESTTEASSIALKLQATATTSPTPFSRVFSVHNAWHISWESSDIATLSPSPPLLPCIYSPLSSWVPGETVDPGYLAGICPAQGEGSPSPSRMSEIGFITIGLPVIGFVILTSCFGCCWYRCRRKRKIKQRAKAERQPPPAPAVEENLIRE